MEELFNKCELCPRKCMVNRNIGEIGYCRASNKMKIGGYHLHMWEEPVITGDKGSGTIFFSYCNLRCVYCQNYDISFNCIGEEITVNRLADIMIELQDMGALNINLVTPSHYIPLIRDSIIIAKDSGLIIPIIYNTSGYDRVESLKLLEGLIDIYLPDFKYYNDKLGKYSNISNYFETASLALKEMYRQTGKAIFDDRGIMKKGMIIRCFCQVINIVKIFCHVCRDQFRIILRPAAYLLILVSSKQIGHQKADHYNWKETAEDKIYK